MPKVVIEYAPQDQGNFLGRRPTDARTKSLAFPSRCPHCGSATTKTVRYSTEWVPAEREILWVDLPVCARTWQPAWLRIIGLVAAVLFVIFGFMFYANLMDALYDVRDPPMGPVAVTGVLAALFGGLGGWAARGYFRVRFTHYHGRSMGFRFIDEEYAREFARLNRGRVT